MDPDFLLGILLDDTEKNESFQEILNKIPESQQLYVWEPLIKILICITAVFLNSIAIYKIMQNRDSQRRTLFLLPFNLALCDLLMALILPLEVYSTFYGENLKGLGDFFAGALCRAQIGVRSINMFVSVFILTYLAFDRYLVVVQSKTVKILRKSWFLTKGQLALVIILWCAGILLSVEPIRRAKMSEDGKCGIEWGATSICAAKFGNGTLPVDNEGYCACPISTPHQIFQAFAFVFSYACPLVILLLSYYSIVSEVHRVELKTHRRKSDKTCSLIDSRSSNDSNANAFKCPEKSFKKTLRVSLICVTLVFGFVILWTPYHIHYIIVIFFRDWSIKTCKAFNKTKNFLIWAMRITNPVLYCFLQMMLRDNSIAHTKRRISHAFRSVTLACHLARTDTIPVIHENPSLRQEDQ